LSSRSASITAPHQLLGVLLALRPDVHPQVGELGHLLPLVRREQVDGLAGHHPAHRPGLRPHRQVLAEQHLHVPPADRLDVQEPVRIDVLHHERDLVAVPGEQDPRGVGRLPGRVAGGEHVAVRVRRQGVGVPGGVLPHHRLDRLLVPGRAGRLEQPLEECVAEVVHVSRCEG
jgi:hypothetical protein